MRRALLVVAALVAATAWGDAKHPNPFLSQAKVFASQGEGDKCLKRLLQAEQKWKFNDKRDRAEIEMYGGICGYLIGETQAAEVSFKNAVKIDPKTELPKDLGPGIEQLWTKATGRSAPIASGNPPPKKEDPKPKVTEAAPPKRDEAPPPPIAPAAQKERQLTADEQLDRQLSAEANASASTSTEAKSRSFVVPVVLGIGAVGAGIGAVILGLQAKSHESQYQSLDTFYSDAQAIGATARTEALVTNILFAAAGALLLGALISFLVSG